MPNQNIPRGFKPVGSVVNASFSGQVNEYRIASGYAADIFAGDCVKLLTTGYINVAAAAQAIRGVAVGFRWIAADGTPRVSPYWPSGTVTFQGGDAFAQVIDDPNIIFEARFTNSTSNPAKADVGALFDLFAGTGNASMGISGQGVDYTTLATGLKQFRFLGFVDRPDNDVAASTSAYAVGRFVAVNHDLRLQAGI